MDLKTHHWRLEVQLAETQRDSDSEYQNGKNISWLCVLFCGRFDTKVC